VLQTLLLMPSFAKAGMTGKGVALRRRRIQAIRDWAKFCREAVSSPCSAKPEDTG
jgi:hypothetical protein